MLKTAKGYYALGFAVHWLHPNSKAPIDTGWTSGPRADWKKLKDKYRQGNNVGVRLGEASKLSDGNYLAVVDCDVKSVLGSDLAEMEEALSKLLTNSEAPQVISGRGNGSRHIYIKVKEPIKAFTFAKSAKKVKVSMPSVKGVSKVEEQELTPEEIKKGIRIRRAWEISILCQGQQVVLPPSIHPDSKKPYKWAVPLASVDKIPLMDLKRPESSKAAVAESGGAFEFVDVDLVGSKLPDRIVDLIIDGKDCEDRSAALLSVALAMLRCGFNDNQVVSVLTDQSNFLGQCAYDHVKSDSRQRAAEWIYKYTLVKAKAEIQAGIDFENEASVEPLTPEEAKEQTKAIESDIDFRDLIERTSEAPGAKPKCTLKNVITILEGEAGRDIFKRDEFACTDFYTRRAPWGGEAGAEVKDIDIIRIKTWLSDTYRFEPGKDVILDAVLNISDKNRFHPVRNFLNTLEWDGKERLDNWLVTYLGAKGPEQYLRDVGRKTICAMVARILKPGCKFDHVLILEGKQGIGKSMAVKLLADPWFSDTNITIGDKDAVLAIRQTWVLEVGELSAMSKADVNTLKQFVSQPVDRIRAPYGRLPENFPRQCIFIGTTNSDEYLKDTTGNRRFWPVETTKLKYDELKRDRNQLLAEALFAYSLGEKLYLDDAEVEKVAAHQQEERVFTDSWVTKLGDWLEKEHENFNANEFTIDDLFADFGPLADWKATRAEQMRAGEALRLAGYEKVRMSKKAERKVFWRKKVN